MDHHPDGVTTADDWALVGAARAGDRLAFGLLYLRHHAAAWRVACVASRFSPDAELAVIEGFTRIFSALPEESEALSPGGLSFRPYVVACVRQSALDRARAARRSMTGSEPTGVLAGLGPDGEIVLCMLEHHVARSALAALPERTRTALWLTDVEAMTPAEIGGILIGRPAELAALAAEARAGIHTAQQSALGRQEVRAGCRSTVDRLDTYRAGTLDPAEGLGVRSHLENCPPCRMRQGELANAPAALAAAVPAAPLLGGEAQHHWLTAAPDLVPAVRLLPPGLAAGGVAPREPWAGRTAGRLGTAAGAALSPALRLPDAARRAGRVAAAHWRPDLGSIDLTTRSALLRPSGRTNSPDPTVPPGWTGSPGWSGTPVPALPPAWTIPPGRATGRPSRDRRGGRMRANGRAGVRASGGRLWAAGRPLALAGGLGAQARRAGRTLRPGLPALSLVVAWFVMMAVLPWMVTPGTSPGPEGLALPAVQAYVPGYQPGATPTGAAAHARSAPAKPSVGSLFLAGAASESAAPTTAGPGPATADFAGRVLDDEPSVDSGASPVAPNAHLIATTTGRPRAATPPLLTPPVAPLLVPVAAVSGPAAPAVTPVPVAAVPTPTPRLRPTSLAPTGAATSQTPAKPGPKAKNKTHRPARQDAPATRRAPKAVKPQVRMVTA